MSDPRLLVGYALNVGREFPDDKRQIEGSRKEIPRPHVPPVLPPTDPIRSPSLSPSVLARAGFAGLPGFLKRFPLKTFCLVLILCSLVKDNYPFSHFPMYDEFPDHTFYVFVKDGRGQPIALEEVTGKRTANFKKPYDKELNRIRAKLDKRKRELSVAEREPAGRRALENLYGRAPDAVKRRLEALAPLQLFHADILMVEGEIVESEPVRIATLPLPLLTE